MANNGKKSRKKAQKYGLFFFFFLAKIDKNAQNY